jgi:predicted nucleic acid-binding protein
MTPYSFEKPRSESIAYNRCCTTSAEISNAFRIEDETQIGFWDAPIVAVALQSGASRVLSEDLNGQSIAGIRIEDPLAKNTERADSA